MKCCSWLPLVVCCLWLLMPFVFGLCVVVVECSLLLFVVAGCCLLFV